MDQRGSSTVTVALQTLGLMYLIETSKRLEVVKGRFDFITQVVEPGLPPLLAELKIAEKQTGYLNAVQQAIGRYYEQYPERPPSKEALALLTHSGSNNRTLARDFSKIPSAGVRPATGMSTKLADLPCLRYCFVGIQKTSAMLRSGSR